MGFRVVVVLSEEDGGVYEYTGKDVYTSPEEAEREALTTKLLTRHLDVLEVKVVQD